MPPLLDFNTPIEEPYTWPTYENEVMDARNVKMRRIKLPLQRQVRIEPHADPRWKS